LNRKEYDGVPVSSSYATATVLLDAFRRLMLLRLTTNNPPKKNSPSTIFAATTRMKQDLYELVHTSQRILHALPDTYQKAQRVLRLYDDDENNDNDNNNDKNETIEIDFGVLYHEQSTRSISWLQDHGTCIDHIQGGKSTLKHAGSGAFAKRFLPKGTLIAASPLHHMFRNLTDMYAPVPNKNNNNKNDTTTHLRHGQNVQRAGQQLLLNYCFGRIQDSTLLLCPYGPGVNFINHNQTLTNVEIRWAANGTSSHNATWLSLTPNEMAWKYKISLAFEYVALDDIEPGDELFMDYGDAWELAWWDHVQRWRNRYNPPQKGGKGGEGSSSPSSSFRSPLYQSAAQFNAQLQRDNNNEPLRTHEDQKKDPYPSNLRLVCHTELEVEPEGLDYSLDTLDINLWDQEYEFEWFQIAVARPCTIVNRWKSSSSSSSSSGSSLNTHTGDASHGEEPAEETCTATTTTTTAAAAAASPPTTTDTWYYDVRFDEDGEDDDDEDDDSSPSSKIVGGLRRRVPRRAISFIDAPYTTDMHLKHAFRHDIQIPDALFPPAWKDKHSNSNSNKN
jgi:hypothetical protein